MTAYRRCLRSFTSEEQMMFWTAQLDTSMIGLPSEHAFLPPALPIRIQSVDVRVGHRPFGRRVA